MRISDWSSDVCSSDLYLADAERPSLGVVLAGNRRPRHWATGKAQGFDAFDATTEALALLSAAGAPVDNLQVFGEAGAAWHPGQSGTLRLGPKTVLAAFRMVHPAQLKAFDLDGPVTSDDRRDGQELASPGRSRWSRYQ